MKKGFSVIEGTKKDYTALTMEEKERFRKLTDDPAELESMAYHATERIKEIRQINYKRLTETDESEIVVGDEVYTSKDKNGDYLDVGVVISVSIIDGNPTVISKHGSIYGGGVTWHKTGRRFDIQKTLFDEIGKVNDNGKMS